MSWRGIAYEVTSQERPGRPARKSVITQKTCAVFEVLRKAGSRGITTKDLPGGQHGRWRLCDGIATARYLTPRKNPSCKTGLKTRNSTANGKIQNDF